MLIACSIRDSDEHVSQFALFQAELISIPFEEQLRHHGTDAFIAIEKRMVRCQTKAYSCNLLNVTWKEIFSAKGL